MSWNKKSSAPGGSGNSGSSRGAGNYFFSSRTAEEDKELARETLTAEQQRLQFMYLHQPLPRPLPRPPGVGERGRGQQGQVQGQQDRNQTSYRQLQQYMQQQQREYQLQQQLLRQQWDNHQQGHQGQQYTQTHGHQEVHQQIKLPAQVQQRQVQHYQPRGQHHQQYTPELEQDHGDEQYNQPTIDFDFEYGRSEHGNLGQQPLISLQHILTLPALRPPPAMSHPQPSLVRLPGPTWRGSHGRRSSVRELPDVPVQEGPRRRRGSRPPRIAISLEDIPEEDEAVEDEDEEE